MRPGCALLLLALLVVCHTGLAAIFDPENLHCKCRKVTSNFIHPSKYATIKITLPGITCRRTEVRITLKTRRTVCVDPEAKWVQALLSVVKRRGPSNPSGNSSTP